MLIINQLINQMISGASGASNYLLAIFILNFKMYFLYYIIMKVMGGIRDQE